ncbi:unnamed protein product [Rotaria sp. Silwood2]|nr:unnamed protein product [Rotaria sp. Silwood2]
MPTTKGHKIQKRSKLKICRKARLSKAKQLDSSRPTRSSSSSSFELSNSVEELFINSLNLTTASSSSNSTLYNLCTSQQKIMAYERRKNNAIADSDEMDFYQVIHNSFLLELMRNTICIGCEEKWNGKMHITSFLGAYLSGIGHAGVAKIFGAMNVPPPVQEDHYEEIDRRLLLPCIKKFQHQSMQAAIYEAVHENDDDPATLTVSGDGTWQRRGFKSIHGLAAVLSSNTTPKVLDVQRLSKKCAICTGALSVKNTDLNLYDEIINNHDCESNYDGSSGGMEPQGIHDIFKRSVPKYQVQYTRYIGDGDSSVMWNLTQRPPYPGIEIEKIEDINHWSKKILYRLEKLTQELKDTMLDPEKKRKGIGGINRLTKEMMIKFKFYYAKVINEYKNDIDMMHKRTWAIYKHRISTNEEPDHDWCGDWCGYKRSLLTVCSNCSLNIYVYFKTGTKYDQQKHSLPKYVMEAIKPVFEDLASKETLQHVLNGSSQNANESFHSLLWSMAPKNRYCSGTIIDICLGLAVMIYNDGYLSIGEILHELLGEMGHFSYVAFDRINKQRVQKEAQWRKRRGQQIAGDEDTDNDEDKNDDTIEEYHSGAF